MASRYQVTEREETPYFFHFGSIQSILGTPYPSLMNGGILSGKSFVRPKSNSLCMDDLDQCFRYLGGGGEGLHTACIKNGLTTMKQFGPNRIIY